MIRKCKKSGSAWLDCSLINTLKGTMIKEWISRSDHQLFLIGYPFYILYKATVGWTFWHLLNLQPFDLVSGMDKTSKSNTVPSVSCWNRPTNCSDMATNEYKCESIWNMTFSSCDWYKVLVFHWIFSSNIRAIRLNWPITE